MRVKFDSLNRYEVPDFTVCNPGSVYQNGKISKVIGSIVNKSDEEIVLNFNAISTLSFRANKIPDDGSEESEYILNIYNKLQNRRLIFVDGIGYFVITDTSEEHSDGACYKDIVASSCEIEIQNKGLTYIADGTYRFNDLLETIVSTLPKWTVGEVSPSIADKYRTFENLDTTLNTLTFFMDNMQSAYECIFSFDIINRRINVYDQSDYVIKTDIHLTKDDLINVLNVSENVDELYTALSVYGGESMSITSVNPLGISTIYNFGYYLDWMSDGLKSRVIEWQSLVDGYFDEYCELSMLYYSALNDLSHCESEINSIQIQQDLYVRCRANIVAGCSTDIINQYNPTIVSNGGKEVSISEDIHEVINELHGLISATYYALKDKKEKDMPAIQSRVDYLRSEIDNIHNQVSIQKFFSASEYDELYDYIFEGIYEDEYSVITDEMTIEQEFGQMKDLYTRARKQLKTVSEPSQEFIVDPEDFIFIKEFLPWSEQLEVGCLVNVELNEDTHDIAELFLTTIQLNWHDRKLNLTFGNRFNKLDPQSLFNNVLGNIKKTSNTLNYIKQVVSPVENGKLNDLESDIQTSRILSTGTVISSDSGEVLIDGNGYTGRKKLSNGEYKADQLKISTNMIALSEDSWDTSVPVLGYVTVDGVTLYGLNAEAMVGSMTISDRLKIYDGSGNDIIAKIGALEKAINDIKERLGG